ncbi:MAG: glycosyltransferase [Ferruginibacter sp.]
MQPQQLHIVTHDVPWPADHGGLIDLFYKIRALHGIGVQLHLHCFTAGRPPQEALLPYCASVNYYRRWKSISRFSLRLPFIVNSRTSKKLLLNLQQDNHPILLEGIHCTHLLYKNLLPGRKIIVRLHNAEFAYYRQLARHERNPFRKFYFRHESRLLEKYERALARRASFLAVSQQDAELYKNHFQAPHVDWLPVFIPDHWTAAAAGNGCFALYHGNLSVNENEVAAAWLLQQVFAASDLPLVIAGKQPSGGLDKLVHQQLNTCLVADPGEKEMQDLISKAHVNVLPAFNNTGIKLKLLNALFNGRHCLVNRAAINGSGLEACCHVADTAAEFREKLDRLYSTPFSETEKLQREELRNSTYNNAVNARRLMQFLQ